MSFDFTALPTKSDFITANPAPVESSPTEQEVYDKRKSRVQARIVRFFSRSNGGGNNEVKVRVGFLSNEDKTALANAVEAKGFTCVEENGLMTIN